MQRVAQTRGGSRAGIGKTKLARIAERGTQAEIIEPRRQAVGHGLVPA